MNIPHLQKWINSKFTEIAKKLPLLLQAEPESFSCGFNMGYKQALLDIDCMKEDLSISYYYCAQCQKEISFNMNCPCCGLNDMMQ